MSKREKLLEKAKRGVDLSGEEFRTLAGMYGIEVVSPRAGSSHFGLYVARGQRIGTVKLPGHGQVKRCYVRTLVDTIEEIQWAQQVRGGSDKPEGADDEQEDEDR